MLRRTIKASSFYDRLYAPTVPSKSVGTGWWSRKRSSDRLAGLGLDRGGRLLRWALEHAEAEHRHLDYRYL